MGSVFGGDHGELGRTGFAGFLSDLDDDDKPPVESPESWAPVGISRGPSTDEHHAALEAFHAWLADQRDAPAS